MYVQYRKPHQKVTWKMKTKFLLIMKPAWTEIKCRITWERREKLKEVLWYWLGRGSVFEWSTENKKKIKIKTAWSRLESMTTAIPLSQRSWVRISFGFELFSGFNFTTAYVVCITAMINHIFMSSSAVQISEISFVRSLVKNCVWDFRCSFWSSIRRKFIC